MNDERFATPPSSGNSLQLAKPTTPVKAVASMSSHHHLIEEDAPELHSNAGVRKSSSINSSISRQNSFNNRGIGMRMDQTTTATTSTTPTKTASSTATNAHHHHGTEESSVDFIGPANTIKNLFSLPYNTNKNVSVALHNMGNGTLLLDNGEEITAAAGAQQQQQQQSSHHVHGVGGTERLRADNHAVRRGRRRQRPQSWSIKEESPDENDAEKEESLQLAQLREGERSLLASLSLLLEEEKQHESQGRSSSSCRQNERSGASKVVGIEADEDEGGAESSNSAIQGLPMKQQHSSTEGALTIPQNSIVLANNNETLSEPIISTASNTPGYSTNTTGSHTNPNNPNSDPKDPLCNTLQPPQHYLSHVVPPPEDPRQFVNWEFNKMKLLVGSDAVIYNTSSCEGGTTDRHNNEGTAENTSIAIRVAETSDLQSQMKCHHEFMMAKQRALPPSSYAEALLTAKSSEDETDNNDGDSEKGAKLLQTCIVPASSGVIDPELAELGFSPSPYPPSLAKDLLDTTTNDSNNPLSTGGASEPSPMQQQQLSATQQPVCTVLDAYLDNIMANVPQLALILREHGFVQNIKLLRTEDIPSLMMHPSTLSSMNDSPNQSAAGAAEPVFSPDIVEMNAAMLLRFLKSNCTRENSTYLLHRAAGDDANIQLFDISSISELRQRKWVWWLALCSYRFACRLEQLQTSNAPSVRYDSAMRREYRNRQRNLLLNTMNLLEELADMDNDNDDNNRGARKAGRHDTIYAAVCEHLADTYLWNDDIDIEEGGGVNRDNSCNGQPVPCASSSQPYLNVTVDCLNKAHDHLMNGIKKLTPLLENAKLQKEEEDKKIKSNKSSSVATESIEIEALSTQLYGIHHKIVNVNLRLADHHYQSYYSSNLIQSLRTAARMLSDATSLMDLTQPNRADESDPVTNIYARSILLQHAWLWEYCGHYARSFAADDLWRERGHTCGADLIGLFREVNASCESVRRACYGRLFSAASGVNISTSNSKKMKPKTTSVGSASHGQVSLNSLSGIVILPHDFEEIEASVLQKEGCHEAIGAAKSILDQKTQIKRDARLVLVAACLCYGHAIDSYIFLATEDEEEQADSNLVSVDTDSLISKKPVGVTTTTATIAPMLRQRLGDACNEIGKILLDESRAVLLPGFSPANKKDVSSQRFGMSHVSAIMLASAQFWFLEGLEQFTEGKDLRNLALLRCNLCQCCKIRANTNVILPGTTAEDSRRKNSSESYLQEAVDHLTSAHSCMGDRDADPITWDMVSEELAATLLVLGVRRRQSALSSSSEPLVFQAMRLTPGAENNIVEPMERSCKIYESLGTARASHQAAAAQYQLALYFSKVWTCQRDEGKTRAKLAAAFKHYGLAHRYFYQHIKGNESTFVVLSLDFSNLYSAVSGKECLSKALLCCLDTREAFASPVAQVALEQMTTLAESVEAKISKLLLNLVKIEKDNNNSKLKPGAKPVDKYKNMYRIVLGHKMKSTSGVNGGIDVSALPISGLLKSLSDEWHR